MVLLRRFKILLGQWISGTLKISKVCPAHSELTFGTKFVSLGLRTAEIIGHLLIFAVVLDNKQHSLTYAVFKKVHLIWPTKKGQFVTS